MTERHSTGFSPAATSLMLGPIVVAVCVFGYVAVDEFVKYRTYTGIIAIMIISAGVFAPTIFILLPVLAIYIIRVIRRQKVKAGRVYCVVAVGCLALQIWWLVTLLGP